MNDLFVLVPWTNTWSDLTNIASGPRPSRRESPGFASADNKLFVFGGYSYDGSSWEGESARGEEWKAWGRVLCEGVGGAWAWSGGS